MIANFFKKTTALSLTVTLVLFTIYYSVAMFMLENSTFSLAFVLEKTGVFIILFFIILLIFFIEQKNNLSLNNGYVTILTVLFICSFPFILFNNYLIYSTFFLLLALRRIYSLRTDKNRKEKIFDASFWIGIAMLFYNWSLIFIVLLYAALLIFKKNTLRSLLIPVIGLITPLFLYFTYTLFFGKPELFSAIFDFKYSLDFLSYNPLQYIIPITIVTGLSFWILIYKRASTKRATIEFKKLNTLVVINLLLSTLAIIFIADKNGSEFLLLTLPFVILLSNYLEKVKEKWFVDSIIIIFLVLPIVVFILQFFSEG